MSKKKCISVLCSTAAAVLMASVVSVGNVKAAVKSYVINNDGKFIRFNVDALLTDYTKKLTGGASPMFDEYMKDAGNLYAFEDDKKGLVSSSSVEEAYANALVGNKTDFSVDNFTENASDTDILKNVNVGYEWKNNGIAAISDNNTTSISLNKTADTLKVGDTDTLTAVVTSNNTTDKNATWTSSDESIAAVDQTGKVTAVKEGTVTITATTADKNVKASCTVTVNAKDNDNTVVTFKDPNLEQVVRKGINKPTGTLYKSDVSKITELDYNGGVWSPWQTEDTPTISDLSGIENLTNLQTLWLPSNSISDISPLKELTNLTNIDLGIGPRGNSGNSNHNSITDISPLKGLTNLTHLDLGDNKISDISILKGLTNLQSFDLSYNKISDISTLKGLTNLQSFDLSSNQISDISALRGLTNLQGLDLSSNQISDISTLKGLANLQSFDLGDNQIRDISALKGLTNLQYLDLNNNQIRDISALKGLTNLQNIGLSSNQISDISALKGLTSLQTLCLGGNQISDSDQQFLETALPNCDIDFQSTLEYYHGPKN